MNSPSILLPAVFLADAALVALAAWLLASACDHTRHGALEAFAAWAWSAVALIVGAGIVLGQVGGLGTAGGFLAVHAIVAAILLLTRKARLASDAAAWRAVWRETRDMFSRRGVERACGVALLTIIIGLTVFAALAKPVDYDGLAYRLPRIGAWLQSGRVEMLASGDARLSYMPVAPDLVMAWLLTATPGGFALVALAQLGGGVMTLLATIGLARETGLSRTAALFAAAALFGMANVVAQFTSTQTDLFTAGVFSVAFFIGWRALRRGNISACGVLGVGLAVASKGTVFYLAPGACLWVGGLLVRHRVGWKRWRQAMALGLVGLAFFAGPGLLRNWRAYGGIFGPPEAVRLHQRFANSPADLAQKLARNLLATAAQLFDPNSQPFGFRSASRRTGLALAEKLPVQDDDAFEPRGRRATLEQILQRTEPDADAVSFGVVIAGFCLLGAALALLRWREASARWVLIWAAGVLAFFVFFEAIVQWHGYGFRFFVLAAPWMAVIAAWGVERLGARGRVAGWVVLLAAAAGTAGSVLAHTHQIGWRAIAQPERSAGYFVFERWREWSRSLTPAGEPLHVALPPNVPLAAFYRQPDRRAVVLAPEPVNAPTAEQAVPADGGWLVVAASRFIGREGEVVVRPWIFQGDELSPFSLVAYRRARPGEERAPTVYRHTVANKGNVAEHDLIVKTWTAGAVRIAVNNPAPAARHYVLFTPLGRTEGTIAAGRTTTLDTPLPAAAASALKLVIDLAPESAPACTVDVR